MYKHAQHQTVAKALAAKAADLLSQTNAFFGDGPAIVLALETSRAAYGETAGVAVTKAVANS